MVYQLLVVGNDFTIVNVGKSGQYETVHLRLERLHAAVTERKLADPAGESAAKKF
jgi:hypothetical protein